MNANSQKPSHLFHVVDKSSSLHFLVDTGAMVSVVPPSQTERKCPQQNFNLQAVNNTAITIDHSPLTWACVEYFAGFSS